MAAYYTVQRNNLDYQVHPVASLIGSIIPGIVIGFICYWYSGRNTKIGQRELENKGRNQMPLHEKTDEHGHLSSQIKLDKAEAADAAKPEQIQKTVGLCPKCKSEVLETSTGYYCGAFDCDFKLPGMFLGQVLNFSQASKLLRFRKADYISGFVSKDGRKSSGWLILDRSDKVVLELDFSKRELPNDTTDQSIIVERIKPQQFRHKTGIGGKIMLWASVGILVSGLFPPWSYTYYRTGTSYLFGMRSEKDAGYYFILNPPSPEAPPAEDRVEDTPAYGVKIDVERLLVEWACILAASGIVWAQCRTVQDKPQI